MHRMTESLVVGELYEISYSDPQDSMFEGGMIPLVSGREVEVQHGGFATSTTQVVRLDDVFFQNPLWEGPYVSVELIELAEIPENSVVLFLGFGTIPQHGKVLRIGFKDHFGVIKTNGNFTLKRFDEQDQAR